MAHELLNKQNKKKKWDFWPKHTICPESILGLAGSISPCPSLILPTGGPPSHSGLADVPESSTYVDGIHSSGGNFQIYEARSQKKKCVLEFCRWLQSFK